MEATPFAELSEKDQVERLAALARRALAAWELPEARLEPIKYRENCVFAVTDASGARSVLRVERPRYRSDAQLRSEAAWMRALAAGGVPTPAVIPTRASDVVAQAGAEGVPEPRQCVRFEWVEGAPLGTLEHGVALTGTALRDSYATVGEIAGRIHEHGAGWTRPPQFDRIAWDVDSLVGEEPAFGRFWEEPALDTARRDLCLRARDRARARLQALDPPRTLIHGDLIPDNLLVSGSAVRVIDFDDCGFSWRGFELVTSLFPLLVSGGFGTGLEGYLEGYRRVAPFPDAERADLSTFVMARALSYLGWPVGRPEIHSQQPLAPFLAARVSELAERYLADEPLAPGLG
ncbi:MAG: phosphotransferase [Myxococcota bacterium]